MHLNESPFKGKRGSEAGHLFEKLTTSKSHSFGQLKGLRHSHSHFRTARSQNATDKVPGIKVTSPQAHVGGKSQEQWANFWWKNIAEIPSGSNPLTSVNGQYPNEFPAFGNVQLLAGVGGSGAATRSIKVSTGTHLFAPLITLGADEVGYGPDWTFKDSLTVVKGIVDAADPKSLFFNLVKKNGIETPLANNWGDYRQSSSDSFSYATPTAKVTKAAQSGYWIMLNPLVPGSYTFHFGSSVDYSKITVPNDNSLGTQFLQAIQQGGGSASQDITYKVTVV